MDAQWNTAEGTNRIPLPGFGDIDLRRDDVGGGRQYFQARTNSGETAIATGRSITGGGPDDWYYEFEQPFFLADSAGQCVEVEISPVKGGTYAVKYHPSHWPSGATGGW